MNTSMRQIFGAFGVLRQRAKDARAIGLAIWADAGERAAKALQASVRDGAHVVETKALSLEDELKAMLADGTIDAVEMKRLCLAPAKVHAIAERAHDLTEVVS
jgi:hypothetical protein